MRAEPRRVVIATANRGKVAEIAHALEMPGWEFVPAHDLGVPPEVEETGATFRDNAELKARAYAGHYGLTALADDSGLEVDALAGGPGVHSARYSGPDATDASNTAMLLERMRDVPEAARTARFRSVVVLAEPGGAVVVEAEGACEGHIGFGPRGSGGFGYDPVFLPAATPGRTMAELTLGEKHAISHRGQALEALRDKLAG